MQNLDHLSLISGHYRENIMKILYIITTALCLTLSHAFALDYTGDVPKLVLRKILLQGKAEYKGKKIVISKDAEVPSSFLKKWDEKRLSGGEVPSVGDPSDDVIFIKSF